LPEGKPQLLLQVGIGAAPDLGDEEMSTSVPAKVEVDLWRRRRQRLDPPLPKKHGKRILSNGMTATAPLDESWINGKRVAGGCAGVFIGRPVRRTDCSWIDYALLSWRLNCTARRRNIQPCHCPRKARKERGNISREFHKICLESPQPPIPIPNKWKSERTAPPI
jgi:hypothetical protein